MKNVEDRAKYIAKTSRASAVRDLNQLLEYGCIGQLEETLDTK